MKILYRDYNDGDVFYKGYGLETCGSAAQFIMDINDDFWSAFNEVRENDYQVEELYTKELEKLTSMLLKYLIENPSIVYEPNTKDYLKVSNK
jgi:hypothetical protein